ncbi:MAG: hypothetical protein HY965_07185 [Ignavibacteriales bacterium]|nr:hypothetical protein [Ignavibacteriales bacterium]
MSKLIKKMILCIVFLGSFSFAQKNLTWRSTSDVSWAVAANWYDEDASAVSTTVPGTNDMVKIDNSRGATVNPTVNTAANVIKQLTVGNGFVLTISGTNTATLSVGDNSSGNYDVIIQNGGAILNTSTAGSGSPFTVKTPSTDVMRIENGGKYTHNTARSFSTPFPNASRSFDASSTVEFTQASATAISMSGSTYGNLIISSTAAKSFTNSVSGSVTINGTLTVTPATTTFTTSITGAHTIKHIANSGTIVFSSTAALSITGDVSNNGTITFNAGSNLTFNGSSTISGTSSVSLNNGAAISSTATVTLNRALSIPTGKTFTVSGTLHCATSAVDGAGGMTVNSSGLVTLGSLNASDAYADNIALTGTITWNASSTLELNGTAAQNLGTRTFPNILKINNGSGVQLLGSVMLQSGITLQTGVFNLNGQTATLGTGGSGTFTLRKINGSLSGTPTFNFTAMTVHYIYSDSSIGVTTGAEIPASISGTLTVSTVNGLTLGQALSVDALVLQNGNLNTTSANLLTVTGTTPAKITANTFFINGPVARTLPADLISGSTYAFPVGKSGLKTFELINPTTGSGATVVVKAEVFDAGSGGTAGSNLSSINTDRYWSAEILSGGENFTNTKIKLTESGLVSTNGIGISGTQTGAYNSLGGTFTGPSVVSTNTTVQLGFFVIGTKSNMGRLYSGVYTVGSGNYPNLTAVLDSLNSEILTNGNVIFELSDSYAGIESLPLTFYPFADEGNNYSVTIRPAADATNIVIAGSSNSGVIILDGVDRIVFDGRPGGTGTDKHLTIRNYAYGANVAAVYMQNDASNNVIRYCNLKAIDTTTSGGVIKIGGSTGSTGNDANTIDNCDINADSSAVGIYSAGSTGLENNNGIISNCTIHDFYVSPNSSSTTYGIRISSGNSGWTISGNSIYQTSARTYSSVDASHRGIDINSAGTGYIITNNSIGGSAPLCAGAPWTITNGAARFFGMNLTTGASAASSVQGNTVKNIAITSNTTSSTTNFSGIYTSDGTFNIGTESPNTIGQLDATDNIVYSLTSNSGSQISAFYLQSITGTINLSNNIVGGMSLDMNNTTNTCDFYVINVGTSGAPGTYVVTNNTIGSPSVANSLQLRNCISITTYYMRGIFVSNGNSTISNNSVKNLSLLSTGTGGKLWGISGSRSTAINAAITISNNTVSDLKTLSTTRSSGNTAALVGVGVNFGANAMAQTISGNTVYNLHDTSNVLCYIYCIYNETSQSSPVNTIEKNKIYNLGSSSDTATVIGIYLSTGATAIYNNMISLGNDIYGNPITKPYDITGIRKATSASTKVFYNTVKLYGTVEGAVTSTTIYSNAFRRSTTGADSVYNNLFINLRGNGTSTQKHFAINLESAANFASDYNDLYCPSGFTGTTDNGTTTYTALADWQAANAVDVHSKAKSVIFAAENDLHLSGGSIGDFDLRATPRGNLVADFDGNSRDLLAPYKGCDERNEAGLLCNLSLTAFIEGFYNGTVMALSDTIKVRLHEGSAPFTTLDSAFVVLDSVTGQAIAHLYNAVNSTPYYIALLHRNSVETWSAAPQQFAANALSYDFSSNSNTAYGSNEILVGSKYCLYSGDVNQDGFIDFSDLTLIDNDSYNFASGYLTTDVNGDLFVDFSDLTLVDNNSYNFIGTANPRLGKSNAKQVKEMKKASRNIE